MNEYIDQHLDEFEKVEIDVAQYYHHFKKPDMNQTYVEQAELGRPIIFAEISPDRLYNGYPNIGEDYYARGYNLIDGHHRLHKAYQLGIKIIYAWILPMEQHYQFMCRGFEEYREYWNKKLI